MVERLATSTYYVTLPNAGVTAEVTAGSTRQARTVYLDHLTRTGIVPWRGRNDLRDQIIIDRISPGQIPTDVQLSYGQQPDIPEEELGYPEDYENGNGNGNGHSPYFEDEDDDLGVHYQGEPQVQPSYYQQQQFLAQPAYGGAERQARTDPQFGGRPEYTETQPTYTGRKLQRYPEDYQVQETIRQRIPVTPPSTVLPSAPVTSTKRIPSPASTPKKLPGLRPGERIPMMPTGSLKQGGPMGETKIAKFVKSRFPKGEI